MMMHSSRWWNTLPLYCIKCSYPYWCALSLYSCCSTVSPGDTSIIFLLEKKIFIIQTCKKYLWIKYQEKFFPIHIGFKCKHIGFLLLRFLFFYKPKFIYISTSRFYAESFLRLRVHPTSVHFFETVYYSFFKIKDKMLKKWFLWKQYIPQIMKRTSIYEFLLSNSFMSPFLIKFCFKKKSTHKMSTTLD